MDKLEILSSFGRFNSSDPATGISGEFWDNFLNFLFSGSCNFEKQSKI